MTCAVEQGLLLQAQQLGAQHLTGQYGAPPVPSQYPYVPQPVASAPSADALRGFWQQQMQEVQLVGTDPGEFKNHQLPLARIKKACAYKAVLKHDRVLQLLARMIREPNLRTAWLPTQMTEGACLQIMKSDEDVRMISAEAPVLFARVSTAQDG